MFFSVNATMMGLNERLITELITLSNLLVTLSNYGDSRYFNFAWDHGENRWHVTFFIG